MNTCRFITAGAVLAVVIVLAGTSEACAGNRAGAFNITPFMGWYSLDNSLPYDDGLTWGVGLGLNFTKKLGAEFTFNSVDSEEQGYDTDVFLYRFDLLYHLTGIAADKIVPYVAAGFGMATYETNHLGFSEEMDFILDTGAGLKVFLSKYVALRGDLRLINYRLWGDDAYNNVLYTAGLTFELGGEEREPPVLTLVGEELCPPAPEGCLEKDWCTKDRDRDGVPDCIDQCPDTPAGCPVDKEGCPLDSDRDGVPDCMDRCPGTPEGATVDSEGCLKDIEKGFLVSWNILFDFGSAELRPESFPTLDEVAAYLKAYPGARMEIQGHTDDSGPAEYNILLSSERAESVKRYLVENGVPQDRIETRGYGLTVPIVPNDTPENRAMNRRVEFRLIR